MDGELHGPVADDQRTTSGRRRHWRRIRRDREQRSHQPPRRDRAERSASEHHPGCGLTARCSWRTVRDHSGKCTIGPHEWMYISDVSDSADHNRSGERHWERHVVRRGSGNRRTRTGTARGRPSFLHHAISKLTYSVRAHEVLAWAGRWFQDRERLDGGGLSVDCSEQRAVGDGRAGGARHRAGCRAGRG